MSKNLVVKTYTDGVVGYALHIAEGVETIDAVTSVVNHCDTRESAFTIVWVDDKAVTHRTRAGANGVFVGAKRTVSIGAKLAKRTIMVYKLN